MKPAEEVVKKIVSLNGGLTIHVEMYDAILDAISEARKEGAKDMRERAAEIVESSEMTDLGIRSLSLPGEDK